MVTKFKLSSSSHNQLKKKIHEKKLENNIEKRIKYEHY